MELIFSTKSSRGKVTKNARVLSNDSTRTSINIDFTANIIMPADTLQKIVPTPWVLGFNSDTTKHVVSLENKGKAPVNLKMVNLPFDEVTAKIKDETIKVKKTGKLEFAWKGAKPEYDINHTLTFVAEGGDTTRFSIPYVIKGEKGVRPPPPKPAVAQKQAAQSTAPNKPMMATEKGMKPLPGNGPAVPPGKLPKPVKADTTKSEKPVSTTPWPPK